MFQSMVQKTMVGVWSVAYGLMLLAASLAVCQADEASPVVITTGATPQLLLNQDNSGGRPPFKWTLAGDENQVYIGSIVPVGLNGFIGFEQFKIAKEASFDALTLREGRIGMNTGTPAKTLHVTSFPNVDPDAVLRLESQTPNSPFLQAWDLSSSVSRFTLKDIGNSTIPDLVLVPFSVEANTPNNTLYLASTGSVGMGTASPNVIGSTTTGGRYVNVRDNVNAARLVVQGASGGELHLVHNSAPANQRNLRISSVGGTASFNVLNDAITGYTVANAIAIKMSNGNIGLKVANPTNPLELASGAKCTAAGVWTSVSSRDAKQDIQPVTTAQARETVRKLEPVSYRYKLEPDEKYVGFIAEDVPELVATNDRKGLAPMDIVAVLTRVVQDQDRRDEEQQQSLVSQREMLVKQQQLITQQQELLQTLTKRLADLEQKVGSRGNPSN